MQANLDQKIGVALGLALRDAGPALALCTVTSAVSFLAFLPTAYRGSAELGVISASGMVIAFVLTLSIIPSIAAALAAGSAGPHRQGGARRAISPYSIED